MNDFDPFRPDFWLPIGAAVACGAVVGVERQVRGKPVGVRTGILICTGTAVYVMLGRSLAGGDPTRVLGQIVTGVGFLGAGVMMVRNESIYGVTTASVIWMLAAIGAVIGVGHTVAAFALAFLTLAVLVGVEVLESSVRWLARGVYARSPKGEDDDRGDLHD